LRRIILEESTIIDAIDVRDRPDGGFCALPRARRLFFLGVAKRGQCSHAVNDFARSRNRVLRTTDNVQELTARTNHEGWETFRRVAEGERSRRRSTVRVLGGRWKLENVSPNCACLEYAKASPKSSGGRADGLHARSRCGVNRSDLNPDAVTPHSEAFQRSMTLYRTRAKRGRRSGRVSPGIRHGVMKAVFWTATAS